MKKKNPIRKFYLLKYFNFCPLVWLFCNTVTQNIYKNFKYSKTSLPFLHSDYQSTYDDTQDKAQKTTATIQRLSFFKNTDFLNKLLNLIISKSTIVDIVLRKISRF